MAQFDNRFAQGNVAAGQTATIDEGLRRYMLSVYNYMAGGVGLTGIVAYAMNSLAITTDPAQAAGRFGNHMLTHFGAAIYGSPLLWLIILAPLGFVFFLSMRVNRMSVTGAQTAFWLFSAVMGVSMSTLLFRYTGQSVGQIFFVTAGAFAGLSIWGYTTRRDLTAMGSFLIMGVWGLIIASLVNIGYAMFSGHGVNGLQFILSLLAVGIFAGLTAYDTQQIKDQYYGVAHSGELMAKSAIMGALSLYLDFINMFQNLLYLFGNRD